MHKPFAVLFSILFVLKSISAQEALFIPNEGQWEKEFTHKTPLKYGAYSLKKIPFNSF